MNPGLRLRRVFFGAVFRYNPCFNIACEAGFSFTGPKQTLTQEIIMTDSRQLIRVGHSPDSDDAFMFYALAKDLIDTGPYRFVHELVDIETLNHRAFSAELELTAISVHAYAYLADKYAICASGASMGDKYGPRVVAKESFSLGDLRDKTIAVPGMLTSAYLAMRLCLGTDFRHVVVPFDQIIEAVLAGQYEDQPIDAGLIIHEGQLTYADSGLALITDLGQWWYDQTELPLPLGANAVRRDLGPEVMADVQRLLRECIEYSLAHREAALDYALQYGRDLPREKADEFVGMYVNDWTVDFGEKGRRAVALFLAEGHRAGVIDRLVAPEFIS